MKTICNKAFCALLLLSAVSCEGEQQLNNMTVISVTLPDSEQTKVSFQEQVSETGLDLLWEEDDCLIVTGETSEKYTLSSFSGKNATFKGKPVGGDLFDIILSQSQDYMVRNYSGQVQSTINSIEHLEYDACLKGVSAYEDICFTSEWAQKHGGTLMQNGCLMLHLKLPQEIDAITRLTLTAPEEIFYMTNSASGEISSALSLDFEDGTLPSDKIVKGYIMTSMQEAVIESGMTLTLTAETSYGRYVNKFTPNVPVLLKPGKRNVIRLNAEGWNFIPSLNYKPLRLVSYNVGTFSKYKSELGHYSYPEAAAVLAEFGADVVGLNESDNGNNRTEKHYQAQKLASELGADWSYYFAYAANAYYGNSIVASPACKVVKEWPSLIIPKDTGLEQRSMGAVEYEDFVFCVTHFDYMNADVLLSGAKVTTEWALENYGAGKTAKPVFMVGDLNCIPEHQAITYLKKYWTMISTDDLTFPCPGPRTKCIDYIFVLNNGADFKVLESEVITSASVADMTLISDHYPVYVDVVIKSAGAMCELDDFSDNSIYRENNK